MGKEKKKKIEVSEIFVAKACPSMVYWGVITRTQDESGNPLLFSRIMMDDGLLCAQSNDQKELAKNLNCIARWIIFYGLHDDRGKTEEIFGSDFFLN